MGFVHRDLRWDNTASSLDGRWYLLDLEMCAREGNPKGTSRPQSWDSQTLVAGSYTRASDLYSFGIMLQVLKPPPIMLQVLSPLPSDLPILSCSAFTYLRHDFRITLVG